jgi:hypothetical protein
VTFFFVHISTPREMMGNKQKQLEELLPYLSDLTGHQT